MKPNLVEFGYLDNMDTFDLEIYNLDEWVGLEDPLDHQYQMKLKCEKINVKEMNQTIVECTKKVKKIEKYDIIT